MFDNDDNLETTFSSFNSDDGFDLLQELERNTSAELRAQRAHFRVAVKSRIVARPGNASERGTLQHEGVTGDVSEGGCRALFPEPIGVGDIYQLQFDADALGIPLTYARCVRCSVVREDAFEAGFQFFKPVMLPDDKLARLAGSAPGSLEQ